jgi:hypothetical protein
VAGPRAQRGQRLVGRQPAFANHGHAVAELFDFAQRMTGKEHGVPGGGHLAEQVLYLGMHQRIERDGRLVEHQQPRAMRKR